MYSGKKDGKKEEGVGFFIKQALFNNVKEFEPISSRLARLRETAKWFNITIIAVHAPTNVSDDLVKDSWYAELEGTLDKVPRHDLLVLLGDFNAKLGKEVDAFGPAIGRHSLHDLSTDNGVRLASLALQYGLVIGGTIFPHKAVHKGTWILPDGVTTNQIDHVLVPTKFRSALQDTRVYRDADIDSDHHLVVAKIQVKLNCTRSRTQRQRKIDIAKVKDEEVRAQYQIEIRNRFELLAEESDWSDISGAVMDAAVAAFGYVDRRSQRNRKEDGLTGSAKRPL